METFTKFLYDFLGQFLAVFILMIQGFFKGIKQTFNIPQYVELFSKYKTSLNKPEWVLVTIALFIVAIVIFLIVAVAILFARRKIKFNKRGLNQDALLDEVATLNNKVVDLMKEKDELMAMKVSQLGLAPGESSTIDTATGESKDENGEKVDGAGLRFPKLISIDEKYADSKIIDHGNSYTLPELCEGFRNFAASRLKLYYNTHMMRLFISAFRKTDREDGMTDTCFNSGEACTFLTIMSSLSLIAVRLCFVSFLAPDSCSNIVFWSFSICFRLAADILSSLNCVQTFSRVSLQTSSSNNSSNFLYCPFCGSKSGAALNSSLSASR